MTVEAGAAKSRLLVTLCSVGALARLSYAMARTPVLPLFAVTLGATPEAIGLVVGISTVTGVLFKMPAGVLSDIVGRRVMLLAGLCVFAVVPFAYLIVTDYWSLVSVRFLHGFATALYGPVAMAAVADIAGARKAEFMSWFSSVTVIGGLCGAPVGGFLLWWLRGDQPADLSAFHTIYLVVGLFGVLALILALLRLDALSPGQLSATDRRSLPAVLQRFGEGVRQILSDYRVIATSSMEGLQFMVLGALEAFLPIYAVSVAGLNAFEAGLLWAGQIAVTLAAKPMIGRVSDRRGRKPLIVGGAMLCAVAFVTIPLVTGFLPLLGLAVVFGLGEALTRSSTAAMVTDMCEERHYGSAMGAFGTLFDVGHAAGPILAGYLIAAYSGDFFAAFVPLAVALMAGAVVFSLTVSEPEREPAERDA